MSDNCDKQNKIIVSFKEYLELQIQEILGPDNMYFTGLNIGHPPSNKEAAQNYVDCGGATIFAKKHAIKSSI